MIRILPSTLRSATSSQPCQGWGSVSVLSAGEGVYRFTGGKTISQGMDIDIAMTGGFNPEPLPGSGRCRVTLQPA